MEVAQDRADGFFCIVLPMRTLTTVPAPTSHSDRLPYLPHVDGLRALAVLLVVVFHAWPTLAPGGFIGVDVFFVISGFIITRQLVVEMENESFSYLAFLGRRARRLVPASLVCSLLATVVAVLMLMPDALRAFSESLLAAWTMVANIYFYANTGYFDAPAAQAPLLHLWSLAVEDQFYLTWPLLLLLLWRRLATRPRILVSVLALAAVSLLHSQLSAVRDPELAFYLPFSRAFELLAGCALALGAPLLRNPGVRILALIDGAGLLLVLGSALGIHAGLPFPGLTVVPAIAGSIMLIGAGLLAATPVSRLLSRGPIVLAGKMSYSIYLYHWPVLAFAAYSLGRAPDAGEAAILVVASLVLAALSWVVVEQWLTRRLGLFDMAPGVLLRRTVAASTAICTLALVGIAGRGWPERLDAPAYAVYSAASTGNPLRAACDGYNLAFEHEKNCTFGPALQSGASYDIAVFGDSNADHFVPMIAALAEQAHLTGRQVTQSSCAPLVGAAFDRPQHIEDTCARYQEKILAFLERNPNLKLAVLSWAWTRYGTPHANTLAALSGTDQARDFGAFLAATVKLFRSRGIQVLIIGQVPPLSTFSLPCLVEAARNDTEETDCTVPRAVVDEAFVPYQSAVEAIDLADDGVWMLDMRDMLCTVTVCSAFKDDVLIYRDKTHLNGRGAAYLARYVSLPKVAP